MPRCLCNTGVAVMYGAVWEETAESTGAIVSAGKEYKDIQYQYRKTGVFDNSNTMVVKAGGRVLCSRPPKV